jgi:dTDP-4-dehydrorhamnose reductase
LRVLVLGERGQLGRELVPLLRSAGHQVTGLDLPEIDITDSAEVGALIGPGRFDRVVNCAAYTQVDAAELHPEQAFAVNRDGPANLARACAGSGAALCHLSTDFVFSQEPSEPPRPWTEDEEPAPRGVYAESKRAGELECLRSGCALFLVRTAWLYGSQGPNFPLSICRAAAAGRRLRVVADQLGSPTWTGDLAPALIRLIEGERFGLYHLTGSGSTTWFHFAKAILQDVGIPATLEPVTSDEWGAAAPRPRYSVLSNGRWRQLGMAPLPAWEQGLLGYVSSERQGALAEFFADLQG